jgi:hypothetical protein
LLAWFEAERKKRPRSPANVDGSENDSEENPQNKSTSTRNEGMLNPDESRFLNGKHFE